jgi:hypothetical protein
MDWLQFIAAVIGHLAWPIVVLIVLFALRKHLGSLAERILELSFGGAKVTFDKYLVKGAELIAENPQPQLPKSDEPQLKLDHPKQPTSIPARDDTSFAVPKIVNYLQRFMQSNRSESVVGLIQILSSLEEIDRNLYDIGDLMGIDAADPLSVAYALVAGGQLPKSMLELYQSLRSAKQVIEHTHALPDEMEASEFVRQAQHLRAFLRVIWIKLDTEKAHAG